MTRNLFDGMASEGYRVDVDKFWDIVTEGNLSILSERFDKQGNPQKTLKQIATDRGITVNKVRGRIRRNIYKMCHPDRSRFWHVEVTSKR